MNITIDQNGCPPLDPVPRATPGEQVTFINDYSGPVNITGLSSRPAAGNGGPLSGTPTLNLLSKGDQGGITIARGAHGTYNYNVSTCHELGGTAQMIVGEQPA